MKTESLSALPILLFVVSASLTNFLFLPLAVVAIVAFVMGERKAAA